MNRLKGYSTVVDEERINKDNVYLCLLAKRRDGYNYLDRAHSFERECFRYDKFYIDKDTLEMYRIVRLDDNINYNLDSVAYDEYVCYDAYELTNEKRRMRQRRY